jgi:NADP-dependent 3-hydroxy acid dehydrogenase YdfG
MSPRASKSSIRRSQIPAESLAQAVAYAMSQLEEVDINEILFRPTRQEL